MNGESSPASTTGLKWLSGPCAKLGEAPIWNPQTRRLTWVDCEGKRLFSLDPRGEPVTTTVLPSAPGSYAFRASGGMIMAYRTKLVLLDANGTVERQVETPPIDFAVERFNDGKCDRLGRFWIGTMDPTMARPTGSLFCVEPDLRMRKVLSDVTVSNGIAFSPDSRVFYHTDSKAETIYAYDFDLDAGVITNRRVFADFKTLGRPDGCTIDAEGHVWAAVLNAGVIVRLRPDGQESARIALPTTRPTSVMFGGDDLETLYITTMQLGLSEADRAQQPLAGCLFWTTPGIQGLPETFFGG